MKRYFFYLGLIILMQIILSSCENDSNEPDILITKVQIKNIMEFDYQDSISYAAIDNNSYELRVEMEPKDADIYYTTSLNGFVKLDSKWIVINPLNNVLTFYAVKKGYKQTGAKKIYFNYNHETTLNGFEISLSEFSSLIHIQATNKQRGEMFLNIYDLQGKKLSDVHLTKTNDKGDFIIGGVILTKTFIVSLNFGGAKMSKQLFVTE